MSMCIVPTVQLLGPGTKNQDVEMLLLEGKRSSQPEKI